ncbi:nucleotidyltransferase family protein [Geothermobacter hydrogeniphilus]|uniref:Polymerase nucleotidyl transferase domain-containing protein n=1 Tax=Geothermobacter hydrogeniphilus TaxID=1969733 RepID=A0A1X0YCV3_9BACT|nr:nucleotidyltransferase domain-containing protein [Geothermobacter hydrogeniphilus]ORJ62998.1 hypothetical protein B5V00_02810 [Geothermobacter hydrogeniphilus]
MIDLPQDTLESIRDILHRFVPDAEIRAFGSRVKGTARSHSDLDLVVVGAERLPRDPYYQLQDAFEESSLPFRVDVLDWHRISPEFRRHIEQGYEIIVAGRG